MALILPVEIIHATESSDGITNNVYHCWLFHSKISEIQIILMFQQNIFLVTFFELCFHMIYQIFFATFSGYKICSKMIVPKIAGSKLTDSKIFINQFPIPSLEFVAQVVLSRHGD